jgi:hypothetical protein
LLIVAAADYAGSCAVVHASADAFEEAVVRTTPNGFVVWFGGVLLFVCVELAAAKEAHLGQRTRPLASFWGVNFINGPRQNWNSKKQPARVAQHNTLVTRCMRRF